MIRLPIALLSAGFAVCAMAQSAPQDMPKDVPADQLAPVQAPPAMDDPATSSGAKSGPARDVPLANSDDLARAASAETQAQLEAQKAAALNDSVTPSTPAIAPANPQQHLDSPGLPPDVQKAAEATELPVITVRQNGNETIEEYRKRGVLYFVRVQPSAGPTRFYVDNRSDIPPNIQQMSAPSGVVEPVYFKIADWK